jgi:dolichol-phosphate mannosyltransferase
MKTLVVIPTFNERENIEAIISGVVSHVPAAQLAIIDDSSTDGTGDEVRRLASTDPRVHLIARAVRGLGTAYLTGFRHALANGFEVVITMDADYSHDPRYLPSMIAMLAEADVVVGSRYVRDGGTINWRIRRILLSWLANRFARWMLGLQGRDLTSGYRVYRSEVLSRLDLDGICSDGYSFLVEVLFAARKAGAQIREHPIIFFDRRMGESKISKREIYRGALTLLRLRWRHGRLPKGA